MISRPRAGSDSQGIGQFGLMGYGLFVGLGFIPPHPCAFNKVSHGLAGSLRGGPDLPRTLAADSQRAPGRCPTACARVSITGQEYWLLEYRLQDPDGDRRFTFSGDLNGNGTPDFYDADSDQRRRHAHRQVRSGDRHARAADRRGMGFLHEREQRAPPPEECVAGQPDQICDPGELGAGSGVFIWHIDEGVILDVFDAPSNLFNADPTAESLWTWRRPTASRTWTPANLPTFMLGGDDDSFRGEDATVFDAFTLPPPIRPAGPTPVSLFVISATWSWIP